MKLMKVIRKLADIYMGALLFYLTVKVDNVKVGLFMYILCNIYVYFNIEYVYLNLRGAYYYNKNIEISTICAERIVKNRLLFMIVSTVVSIVNVIVTINIFM